MFRPRDVLNWTYEDLEDFLNSPTSSVENDQYDFKQAYEIEPEKLRKCFSAFANSKGGFVFFGIDNNRNICGIERNDEITTHLNRVLNNPKLRPRISKWHLLNSITTPRKKGVFTFIIYILAYLLINLTWQMRRFILEKMAKQNP